MRVRVPFFVWTILADLQSQPRSMFPLVQPSLHDLLALRQQSLSEAQEP